MKKTISLLLSVILVFGLCVNAFALSGTVESVVKPIVPSTGGGSASGGGGGGGGVKILPVGSVESDEQGSLDFYVAQEGHKIHWGGGIWINDKLTDESFTLFVAIYDGERLVHTSMSTVDECVSDFVFKDQTVWLSYIPTEVSAKAFLWSADGKCIPLAEAVKFNKKEYTEAAVRLFSASVQEKYVAVSKVNSYPELVYNNSGAYIKGTFEFEIEGEDYYDIVMNIKNGNDVLFSKTVKADSRMKRISVYEPLENVELSDTCYLQTDLIHNNRQLQSTHKTGVTDGYSKAFGRVLSAHSYGSVFDISIESSDDFFGKQIDDAIEIEAEYGCDATVTEYVYAEMTFEKIRNGYKLVEYTPVNSQIYASDYETEITAHGRTVTMSKNGGSQVCMIAEDAVIICNGELFDGTVEDLYDYHMKYNIGYTLTIVDTVTETKDECDGLGDYVIYDTIYEPVPVYKYLTTDIIEVNENSIIVGDEIEYEFSNNLKCIINGVEVADDIVSCADKYIGSNGIGTVVLVDNTYNGKIDVVDITLSYWAIADAVDEGCIYLSDFQPYLDTPIRSDEISEVVCYKNGIPVDVSEIKEKDVLLVTCDLTKQAMQYSDFVRIDVCDNVVCGVVTKAQRINGLMYYTINDKRYTSVAGSLTVGNEYVCYTDCYGRIIVIEKLFTGSYGIIDRVYRDNNTDEDKIRIIKDDGTRQAYVVKDASIASMAESIAYVSGTTLEDFENRVVKYKTNLKNEINYIELLPVYAVMAEYDSEAVRVGPARMNEDTRIIDMTDVFAMGAENDASWYTSDDISGANLHTFIDGMDYEVLYGDKGSDGAYKFVIIKAGNRGIGVKTNFAVVLGVSSGLHPDGSVRYLVEVVNRNGIEEFFYDEDLWFDNIPNSGDVLAYGLNKNGEIDEITMPLFSAEIPKYGARNVAEEYTDSVKADDPYGVLNEYFTESHVPEWDYSDATGNNARVGFGAVVDTDESEISVATLVINQDNDSVYSDNIATFEFTDNVNVIVCEYTTTGYKLSKGTTEDILYPVIPEECIKDGVYDWDEITENGEPEYVYFKTLNGDISDIFVMKHKKSIAVDYTEVVTGKVEEITNASGAYKYLVNGEYYAFADGAYKNLLIGSSYKLFLDADGNIIVYEEIIEQEQTTRKFGVFKNLTYSLDAKGQLIETLEVYENGVSVVYELSDVYVNDLNYGSVISYEVGDENKIVGINILLDVHTINKNGFSVADASDVSATTLTDPEGFINDFYIPTGVPEWDKAGFDADGGYTRAGFGILTDKMGDVISVAKVKMATDDITNFMDEKMIPVGSYYSLESDIHEFMLSDDVNVYVFDYSLKWGSNLLVSSTGNIVKTFVSESMLYEDYNLNYAYNWTEIETVISRLNYVYFRITDGYVTDVMFIKTV